MEYMHNLKFLYNFEHFEILLASKEYKKDHKTTQQLFLNLSSSPITGCDVGAENLLKGPESDKNVGGRLRPDDSLLLLFLIFRPFCMFSFFSFLSWVSGSWPLPVLYLLLVPKLCKNKFWTSASSPVPNLWLFSDRCFFKSDKVPDGVPVGYRGCPVPGTLLLSVSVRISRLCLRGESRFFIKEPVLPTGLVGLCASGGNNERSLMSLAG